jgi:hypothetical protein
MKDDLSAVERLNLLARVRGGRVWYYWFYLLVVADWTHGVENIPRPNATFSVLLICAAAFTASILVFAWRFHLYAAALWFFIIVAYPAPLRNPVTLPLKLQSTGTYLFALLIIGYVCFMLRAAVNYAEVNGRDWKKERNQMDRWARKLTTGGAPNMVEFEPGGFIEGGYTWRILNSGSYWAIGRFRSHRTWLGGYYFCEPGDVTFTKLPSGRWRIDIRGKKNKTFNEVELSPGLPQAFEPFVQSAMGFSG